MNETDTQRYELSADGGTRGRDTLLGIDVTVTTLDSDEPERLARWLRRLPTADWLDFRDAVVHQDRVLVVMPSATGTLATAVEAGLPEQRRSALADALTRALDTLAGQGLAPRTLDPSRLEMSRSTGPLLVPAQGAAPETGEVDALLDLLRRVTDPAVPDDAPTSATGESDGRVTAGPRAAIPVMPPTRPGAPRRVGLSPAETGARPPRSRGRVVGVLAGLAVIVAVGFGSLSVVGAGNPPPAAFPAAPGRPTGQAPTEASPASRAVDTVLAELVARPADAGSGGSILRDQLAAVQTTQGPQRAFAAAGVMELVRIGGANGRLVGPVVGRAQEAAAPLAQPADLPALIALVSIDPPAFGSRAPALLSRLQALSADPAAGGAAAVEAADLLTSVRDVRGEGGFTPTLATLAEPVLRPLTADG